jgi:hypothetical protein
MHLRCDGEDIRALYFPAGHTDEVFGRLHQPGYFSGDTLQFVNWAEEWKVHQAQLACFLALERVPSAVKPPSLSTYHGTTEVVPFPVELWLQNSKTA